MHQWEVIFGEKSSFGIYLLSACILFFYIPFVVLVILYSIILIKLKNQVHPGEQSASAEEQRTRRNRNVLKMTIAIVVAFFICRIPFSIQLVTIYFIPKITLDCKFFALWEMCNWRIRDLPSAGKLFGMQVTLNSKPSMKFS